MWSITKHCGHALRTNEILKEILEEMYEGNYIECIGGCTDPVTAIKILNENLCFRSPLFIKSEEETIWDFYYEKLKENIEKAREEVEAKALLEKRTRRLEKRVAHLENLLCDLTGEWPEDIEEFEVE